MAWSPDLDPSRIIDHPGSRRIEGAKGQRWEVFEDPGSDEIPGPSLIFAGDYAMRRVRDFPRNWRDIPDAELVALAERV